MLTLNEFITNIYDSGHFRVYIPNRDCLGYESFREHHCAPGVIGDFYKDLEATVHQVSNCFVSTPFRGYRDKSKINWDEETKEFLKQYGDCEVTYVEVARCNTADIIYTRIYDTPSVELRRNEDHDNYEDCLNIFIKAA